MRRDEAASTFAVHEIELSLLQPHPCNGEIYGKVARNALKSALNCPREEISEQGIRYGIAPILRHRAITFTYYSENIQTITNDVPKLPEHQPYLRNKTKKRKNLNSSSFLNGVAHVINEPFTLEELPRKPC